MGRPVKRKGDNYLSRRRNVSIRHSRSIHGTRPPAAEILRTRSARWEIALSLNTNPPSDLITIFRGGVTCRSVIRDPFTERVLLPLKFSGLGLLGGKLRFH